MPRPSAHPARKPSQPYRTSTNQTWTSHLVQNQHEEALYALGELCLFTLMWRPADFEAGLVARCPVCFGGAKSRQAAAFDQPVQKECPACFGTTFEGGFRAQVIRPAMLNDRNGEMTDEARGTVIRDTLQVETTGDFSLRKGDYITRFDNVRYQVEERKESVLRDGFGPPLSMESFGGSTTAYREDDTTVAYRIPPVPRGHVRSLLAHAGHALVISDITLMDLVRPGGYIMEGQASLVLDPQWPPLGPVPDPDDPDDDHPHIYFDPVRFDDATEVWVWNHNLGTYPNPMLFIDSQPGERIYTSVTYPDMNTTIITWPSPESGWIYPG